MLNSSNHPTNSSVRKTVTMTFRIDESIMNKLRNESEKREVSLNTLVKAVILIHFKLATDYKIKKYGSVEDIFILCETCYWCALHILVNLDVVLPDKGD